MAMRHKHPDTNAGVATVQSADLLYRVLMDRWPETRWTRQASRLFCILMLELQQVFVEAIEISAKFSLELPATSGNSSSAPSWLNAKLNR
jgi:hypothetical protein